MSGIKKITVFCLIFALVLTCIMPMYAEEPDDVCVVKGKIKLPDGMVQESKTCFYVYINIDIDKASVGRYSDTDMILKLSDEEAEYEFEIPAEWEGASFILSYDYGSYDDVSQADFPSSPSAPLKKLSNGGAGVIKPGGGSSGGGGIGSGGGGGIIVGSIPAGYSKKAPSDLLINRLVYVNSDKGSLYQKNAEKYKLGKGTAVHDIILAQKGDVSVNNRIGGYFTDTLKSNIKTTIKLSDALTKAEKYSCTVGADGKYLFENIDGGLYVISAQYGDKTYYYSNKKLVEDITEAEIIDTQTDDVSFYNDMWRDNIYPVDITLDVTDCSINGFYTICKIGVYDIYGNKHAEFDCSESIEINFSPFVLEIDGRFASAYNYGGYTCITELTDNFNNAEIFEAKYSNVLNPDSYSGDTIVIDAILPKMPTASNWIDEENITEPVLSKNVFYITTPQELAWVAYKSKEGSTFRGKTVMLMNDIDLSQHQWTPIGGQPNDLQTSDENTFCGSFDGGGHVISGLNMGSESQYAEYEYCGLFGMVSGEELKNVRLENVSIYNSGQYAGGLVGCTDGVKISNVTVDGSMVGHGVMGGIVGHCHSYMINCASDMSLMCKSGDYSGNAVGYMSGTIENCTSGGKNNSPGNAGGLGGYIKRAENCFSNTQTLSQSDIFAYSAWSIASTCYYNSDLGSNDIVSKLLKDKSDEEVQSEDFLSQLNDNSKYERNDWIFGTDGYPTLSNKKDRFWRPCDDDLTEVDGRYEISTPNELAKIADMVNNGDDLDSKTVVLSNDIDLSGKFWLPIGDEDNSFKGDFDGGGHVVSGLKFNSDTENVGLFGVANDGSIKNLKLSKVDIIGGDTVGALGGMLVRVNTENVVVDGKISGGIETGGIAGYISGGNIKASSVNAKIIGKNDVGGVGGWCGWATVEDCKITSEITGERYVGGIIGMRNSSHIKNCYADSDLVGTWNVGAVVGYTNESAYNSERNVYWNLSARQKEDGFELKDDSKKGIGNSDYDSDTAVGILPSRLADEDSFVGFDFDNIWCIGDGEPQLRNNFLPRLFTINAYEADADGYISACVRKNSDSEDKAVICYAVYDAGILCDIVIDVLSMEAEKKDIRSSKNLNIPQYGEIKVFVLNDNAVPLAE